MGHTMTTRSPSVPSNPTAIPVSELPAATSAPPPEPPAEAPRTGVVDELVRAAVADRPLEEVAQLITLLQRSPDDARAAGDALRSAGVGRSVEDVARLVILLTQPPRPADSADELIRAATERRPVEEVSQLMALLHRTALEPHCEQEAMRTAATRRPIEELVDLIGRLGVVELTPPPSGADDPQPAAEGGRQPEEDGLPWVTVSSRTRAVTGGRREAAPGRVPGPPPWPARLAAVLLPACGAAHAPLTTTGLSAQGFGTLVGVSALCVMPALVLFLRPAVVLLVAAVVVPAALADWAVFADRFGPERLTRVLEAMAAPPWQAGAVAVCTAVVALTALLPALQPTSRPAPAEPAPETPVGTG